jgi:transcriptional regulator with GAF, ATPase, and Fis domain
MDGLTDRLQTRKALGNLCGESTAFLKVVEQLPAVAKSEATVLVTGETGTGKELVARSIHYLSKRAPFPFVAVNCGSLPDTLLEDELFGHEQGAFTDARSQRRGVIAQAEKGTLFLDEVGALTPRGQVALLRVLQDRSYRPIGCSREQLADVRVVAATNSSLDELVRAGSFRSDFYYRLCVFAVYLPPLRDRREDIIPLARHFLKKHAPNEPTLQLASAVCGALVAHEWPGNVRELENVIIRAIHLGRTKDNQIERLGIQDSLSMMVGTASAIPAKPATLKMSKRNMVAVFEKNYLTRLMWEHSGNVSRAALAAGKERRDLGKLLKKYNIDPKIYYTPRAKPARG